MDVSSPSDCQEDVHSRKFTPLMLTCGVILDENSRKYTTINMQKGLFQYTRMPFGVSSAPAIFRSITNSILIDIPGVCCYLDDILVTGGTEAAHLEE